MDNSFEDLIPAGTQGDDDALPGAGAQANPFADLLPAGRQRRSDSVDPVSSAASAYGVDPMTMRAFAGIESGGNPKARTGSYKGLFQLSDDEFARNGGAGDIYDPSANANAAARKIRGESDTFAQQYGRQPTAGELYLIHLQGWGGAQAHWANPNQPAWQSMYSTAEGRQKGPDWAKRAIWGNVPNDVKAQYGSVDNLTSGQFADLWNNKVAKFGAPPIALGDASLAEPSDWNAGHVLTIRAAPAGAVDSPFGDLIPARAAQLVAPSPVPPTSTAMPGILGAGLEGAKAGTQQLRQTIQAAQGQPLELSLPSKAAEPLAWSDLTSPFASLAPKLAYRFGESYPTLAGGVAGGVAGGAGGELVAGPPGAAVGGIAGGAAGAAAASAAQTLGPYFAAEIKQSPNDADGAWSRALHKAEISGAFSGASWALFPARFFEGPVKNVAFQIFGVQPAVSEAERATSNVMEGRPATEGMGQTYAESVAGTALPVAAGHGAIAAFDAARGGPRPKVETPPPSASENPFASLIPDNGEGEAAPLLALTAGADRLAYGGSGEAPDKVYRRVDRTALETQAEQLRQSVQDYEDEATAAGSSPNEIASGISDTFGFDVNPQDVASGNVWWRVPTRGSIEPSEAVTPSRFTAAPLAESERADVLGLSASGLAPPRIAEQLRLDPLKVAAVVQAAKPKPIEAPRDASQLSHIEQIYTNPDLAGLSAAAAAERLSKALGTNVTERAVYRARQRAADKGAELPQMAGRTASVWTDDALAALHDAKARGLTDDAAAAELNKKFGGDLSVNAVRKRLSKHRNNQTAGGRSRGEPPLLALAPEQAEGQRQRGISEKPPLAARGEDVENRGWMARLTRRREDVTSRVPDTAREGMGGVGARSSQRGPGEAPPIENGERRPEVGGNGKSVRRFSINGRGRGAVVETPNINGLRQRRYFVFPGKSDASGEISTARSPQVAQRVHKSQSHWVAKAHLSEVAPGDWQVLGVNVRKNLQRRGVGGELYDALSKDVGVKLGPSPSMTRNLGWFWLKRDPEAMRGYVRIGDRYYSPEMLADLKRVNDEILRNPATQRDVALAKGFARQLDDALAQSAGGTPWVGAAAGPEISLSSMARGEQKFGLKKERQPQDLSKIPGGGFPEGSRGFDYEITRDGRPTGMRVSGYVDGDKAHIDWIGDTNFEAQNTLGISGIKQLREAIRKDFPKVKTFTGERVSGARYETGREDANMEQSVYLPSIGGGPPPIPPRYTPEFQKALPELISKLDGFLKQALPPDVATRVADRLFDPNAGEIRGRYRNRLLELAIFPKNRFEPERIWGAARHELMHALRQLELFRDNEWATLTKAAADRGIEKLMQKDDEAGLGYSLDSYRAHYSNELLNRGYRGEEFHRILNEYLEQELVARMAQDWAIGKGKYPSVIAGLFNRIKSLIEALHNWMSDLGFNSPDKVFQKAFSGEIAGRSDQAGRPRRPLDIDLPAMASTPPGGGSSGEPPGRAIPLRPGEIRITSDDLIKRFGKTDASGALEYDNVTAEAQIKRAVKNALTSGRTVDLVVEGKRRSIIGVTGFGLKDADGNSWGTTALVMNKPGETTEIRIGSKASATQPRASNPSNRPPPIPQKPQIDSSAASVPARRAPAPQNQSPASGAPGGLGGPPPIPPGAPPPIPPGGHGAPPPPPPINPARAKPSALRPIIDAWTRNVQPELASDKALQADPRFAQYRAASAQRKDAIVAQGDEDFRNWNKVLESRRLEFMHELETGNFSQMTTWERQQAASMRKRLDTAYALEKVYGSKAEYVDEYLPHIWTDAATARQMFQNLLATNLGPTWFQKARTIDLIKLGLDHGLELKSTNPEKLVEERLFASADMVERMSLLRDLRDHYGLAYEAKQIPPRLATSGWQKINAPDRQQWLIAPDIAPLWKNAVEAKGLWSNEHLPGSFFRGWMAFKNAWVPIKLALSLFHPLHVFHINMSQDLARAFGQLLSGDVLGAAKSIGDVAAGPVAAGIPYVPHRGKAAKAAWLKDASQRTPEENFIVTRMQEGGFSPQLSEQLRIAGQRALSESYGRLVEDVRQGKVFKVAGRAGIVLPFQVMKRGLETVQKPIFERWIPALKTAAYLSDADAFFKRRPDLLNDDIQRKVALRTIAKSVDNRFGEMFYSNLFWNRTMKDAGIGAFLSLGWNLGFIREFGGGALEPLGRILMRANGAPSLTRETMRSAQSKTANLLAYTSTAMAIGGAMTYGLSGQMPQDLTDYIFPRVGGKNPDGTPRRITTMFYTREVPMALKHIQDEGGGFGGTLAGLRDMLYNKLLVQPIMELYNNRSYFGYDIRDPQSPMLQQLQQLAGYLLKNQIEPLTVSGYRRAIETGGSPEKEGALAFLGFGPAPAYASRTGTQNLISSLYRRYVTSLSKPQEAQAIAEAKQQARTEYQVAQQRGDQQGMKDALHDLRAAKGKLFKEPSDVYQFSRLPPQIQQSLIQNEFTREERKVYLKHANKAVAGAYKRAHAAPVSSTSAPIPANNPFGDLVPQQ